MTVFFIHFALKYAKGYDSKVLCVCYRKEVSKQIKKNLGFMFLKLNSIN